MTNPLPWPTMIEVKKTNWLLIFLIILDLIFLSISGWLFFQNRQLKQENKDFSSNTTYPSPSPAGGFTTENWKTYINRTSNYSISYPPDWKISNNEPFTDKVTLTNQRGNSVEATIYLERVKGLYTVSTKLQSGFIDVPIGAWVAYCQQTVAKNTRDCRLNVPDQNQHLLFSFYLGKDFVYDRQVAEILTTFRFLDPLQDTSFWLKYSDPLLGIEFKYPQNLSYKVLNNGVVQFFDETGKAKFNFNGVLKLSPNEFGYYQWINWKEFTDSQMRKWQTDIVLGEVYNFNAFENRFTQIVQFSLQSGIDAEEKEFRAFAEKVLGTFKFID